MKKRLVTIILASVLGVTGMGLTACAPSPNDHYTGDAVISGVQYRSALMVKLTLVGLASM